MAGAGVVILPNACSSAVWPPRAPSTPRVPDFDRGSGSLVPLGSTASGKGLGSAHSEVVFWQLGQNVGTWPSGAFVALPVGVGSVRGAQGVPGTGGGARSAPPVGDRSIPVEIRLISVKFAEGKNRSGSWAACGGEACGGMVCGGAVCGGTVCGGALCGATVLRGTVCGGTMCVARVIESGYLVALLVIIRYLHFVPRVVSQRQVACSSLALHSWF